MITASQCRAARALIEWSEEQLAERARVSVRTVCDFEHDRKVPPKTSLQAIEAALRDGGVALVADGRGGVGVRLRSGRPATNSLRRPGNPIDEDDLLQ